MKRKQIENYPKGDLNIKNSPFFFWEEYFFEKIIAVMHVFSIFCWLK